MAVNLLPLRRRFGLALRDLSKIDAGLPPLLPHCCDRSAVKVFHLHRIVSAPAAHAERS